MFVRVAVAMAAMLTCAPATADSIICTTHVDMVTQLSQKYGEARDSWAISTGGSLTEIFVNRKTGTWSILMTEPHGPTCLMAAGKEWHDDDAAKGEGT